MTLMDTKRLAVAPMMDWTDRHCRTFHRSLTNQAILYSEMVTTGALIYGDVPRHLDYSECEHPVVLQLGGSEPLDLARGAQLAKQWGYDEIDLNCGCPSERVQRGSFGACLMAEPDLVADCVKAMVDAVDIPITVKHRIGLNDMDVSDNSADYQFTLDFICKVAQAGASQVTIHARNAILKGLSPKENRSVPPLHYDIAKRLRLDAKGHFPHLKVVLNGGLQSNQDIVRHWNDFDGFMVGRAAYHTPAMLMDWDYLIESDGQLQSTFLGAPQWERITLALISQACLWLKHCQVNQKEFHLGSITRHIMGLAHGMGGSKHWRRRLSDYRLLAAVKTEQQIEDFFRDANAQLRLYIETDAANEV
jgi:tRNA-dihydrouridine synthase A